MLRSTYLQGTSGEGLDILEYRGDRFLTGFIRMYDEFVGEVGVGHTSTMNTTKREGGQYKMTWITVHFL